MSSISCKSTNSLFRSHVLSPRGHSITFNTGRGAPCNYFFAGPLVLRRTVWITSDIVIYSWRHCRTQGRRKHLKLGGGAWHFEGTFFLKKKGACPKHEKGTSLFIEKSWGALAPSAPRFLRLCQSSFVIVKKRRWLRQEAKTHCIDGNHCSA